MAVPLIDLRAQYAELREEIDQAIRNVVESQQFILGPVVSSFEEAFAEFVGCRHAVGCASGTDALLLALRALDLEPGSDVVVPAFTFFATAGAVWNAGLRPVFADIDPLTFNVTAETLESALTDRTRAVVVVHLYGQMAEMDPIMELARERGLAVIEDAAQAMGARQRGRDGVRAAGTVGDVGCFSFFPTKVLGGFGDGGMVVTANDALAERVRSLRVHGGTTPYIHEWVGVNSRLDALQAAVLAVKLRRVPEWLEKRRAVARWYDEALGPLAPAVRVPVVLPGNESASNVYTVRARDRDGLRRALGEAGVATAIYYPLPLHLQPCFRALGHRPGDLPVSEEAAGEVLSLPIYPEMSLEQVGEVAAAIRTFYS